MEDYKEEIRNLLLKYYTNAGDESKKIRCTTADILQEVRGVIPSEPVSEHDIYEIMKAMYFEQAQEIVYEKVCIFVGNKRKGLPPEYETQETGRRFVWELYLK
ncbi:MAG: hypothetical protein LBE36_06290 [Flavobacteriaceae bacterium]|jgi:hypothetical protein|nr:hypothetical protein [Flavobacteriaceae bacterium]